MAITAVNVQINLGTPYVVPTGKLLIGRVSILAQGNVNPNIVQVNNVPVFFLNLSVSPPIFPTSQGITGNPGDTITVFSSSGAPALGLNGLLFDV